MVVFMHPLSLNLASVSTFIGVSAFGAGKRAQQNSSIYAQPCEPLLRDFRSQCATNKHIGIRNT
jgi:hypothetical protein